MSLKSVSVKINDQNSARIRSISYENNINVKFVGQQPSRNIQYLKDLKDVDAFSPVDKDTLIFNGLTGKFEAKPIEVEDIQLTNVDAGTF